MTPCHDGRPILNPWVREFMRTLGVKTCPRCFSVIAVASRRGWIERGPRK